MKTVKILFILLWCGVQLPAQVRVYDREKFNPELKKELDKVMKRHMQYRRYMIGASVKTRDSLAKAFGVKTEDVHAHLEKLQAPIDSENMEIVTTIIRHYDYPGKTLVGEPTNIAAAYVIMHSTEGKRYYPRINQSHVMGEVPEFVVAMLEDHNFVRDGFLQKHGSHAIAVPFLDTGRNQVTMRYYISPMKKGALINTLRRGRGFTTSIEEYAREINATYDPNLTWEKVAKMRADAVMK